MKTPLIDIRPDHWVIVADILHRHVPGREVWTFGSRATWSAKEYSDLDLAIIGDTPLNLSISAALADDFSESDLPFKVDIVDWATTSESFRKIIERDKVVVQEGMAKAKEGMAGEWQRHEVSDLLSDGKLAIGDGYRAKSEELSSSGMPFARAGNINNGFRFEDTDRFPEQDLARVGNKVSQPGDVVFTSKGTVGRFAFVRPDTPRFVYSPQLCFWRSLDSEQIDPQFLYYWMYSREFFVQFKGVAGQTDMAEYVSLTDQRRMHITLPSIDEQRAIAHILGTLDDKIELNRRMNETLEAMARALFKSWFVDFDPVRAKAEGRDPGLPKSIADLFPDSFDDSELGEIPEGWEVKKIGDFIGRLSVGQKYEQKTVSQFGKVPVLDQGKSGVIGYHNDAPGVIASIDAPVVVFANHTCYMRLIHFPFSAIQNVLPFIGKTVDTIWAFYATYGKQSFIEYKGHWPDFVIHKIAVPEPQLTKEFARLVRPLIKQAWVREDESSTLAIMRDTLLPKLLSGEITTSKVEVL